MTEFLPLHAGEHWKRKGRRGRNRRHLRIRPDKVRPGPGRDSGNNQGCAANAGVRDWNSRWRGLSVWCFGMETRGKNQPQSASNYKSGSIHVVGPEKAQGKPSAIGQDNK